jgi:diguanylate cyclase
MLRRFLQALGAALDGLEVAFCAFDRQQRALAWNQTFLAYFPEHEGHLHVGEPYAANLRRFYRARLGPEELPSLDRYVDEALQRHQIQRRPYEFDHRSLRVRVTSLELWPLGSARLWRKVQTYAQPVAQPISSTRALADVKPTAVLTRITEGVLVMDVANTAQWANPAFLHLYGMSCVDDIRGLRFEQIFRRCWQREGAQPEVDPLAELRLLQLDRYAGASVELPLPGDRWVRVAERAGDEVDGRGYFVHVDITEFKRQQRELLQVQQDKTLSEERYRLLAEYSRDVIVALQNGRMVYVSPAVTEALGWPPAEVLGARLVDYCHPEDLAQVRAALRALGRAGEADYSARALHRQGHYVWMEARARRLPRRPDRPRLVINLRNIAARKRVEDELEQARAELEHLARHDPLTSLANRRVFDMALDSECRRASREGHSLSLLMLDLDNFKQLNDSRGHLAGDIVLRSVGRVLAGFARRAGDVAARYGGEEFAVLLPDTDEQAACALAQEICQAMREIRLVHVAPWPVTASVGVATRTSADTGGPDMLLRQADQALYAAKRQGKDRYVMHGQH